MVGCFSDLFFLTHPTIQWPGDDADEAQQQPLLVMVSAYRERFGAKDFVMPEHGGRDCWCHEGKCVVQQERISECNA